MADVDFCSIEVHPLLDLHKKGSKLGKEVIGADFVPGPSIRKDGDCTFRAGLLHQVECLLFIAPKFSEHHNTMNHSPL